MKFKKAFVVIFLYFIIQHNYSAEIEITNRELSVNLVNSYNRVFHYSAESSVALSLSLNDIFIMTGGFSAGGNYRYDETNAIASMELSFGFLRPHFFKHLFFGFFYQFEEFPNFEMHCDSIVPALAFKGKIGGIAIGWRRMWTSYYGEYPIDEAVLAFRTYLYVINARHFSFDVIFANYDLFYMGSYGAFYLGLNTVCKINDNVSINNDLNVYQSGSVGFTGVLYGLSLQSGVKISW
jgi:hypothetical protein